MIPVTLDFADGKYTFKITLGGIREIQTKCRTGMGAVYARILKGRYISPAGDTFGNPLEGEWYVEDLIEVIRQGLLGGGSGMVDGQSVKVDETRAQHLIENYVVGKPLAYAWKLAAAIVTAANEGFGDADEGEEEHPIRKKSESEKIQTDGLMSERPSPTVASATPQPPKRSSSRSRNTDN
jgi:hypothetical protein